MLQKNLRAIIVDSPVEFVIIGSINNRLQTLIKSRNAGIDLIGFSQKITNSHVRYISSIFSFQLFPQMILSQPMVQLSSINPDIGRNFDDRNSSYKFIWRGFKDFKLMNTLSEEFNKRLPDIIKAIENEDEASLEWVISPLITFCNQSIFNKRHNRYITITTLIIYIALIIIFTNFIIQRVFRF